MNIETQILISISLYKITSLIIGTIFCFFGYKLFLAGIWGQAGDLETTFGNNKIVLKRASPGIFFALFGAAIIITTLTIGLEIERHSQNDGNKTKNFETKVELPDEPPI